MIDGLPQPQVHFFCQTKLTHAFESSPVPMFTVPEIRKDPKLDRFILIGTWRSSVDFLQPKHAKPSLHVHWGGCRGRCIDKYAMHRALGISRLFNWPNWSFSHGTPAFSFACFHPDEPDRSDRSDRPGLFPKGQTAAKRPVLFELTRLLWGSCQSLS